TVEYVLTLKVDEVSIPTLAAVKIILDTKTLIRQTNLSLFYILKDSPPQLLVSTQSQTHFYEQNAQLHDRDLISLNLWKPNYCRKFSTN
ncbi:hypothetical protein GcC1_025033, partial [Golovinomyces cichoracearum]